MRSEIGPLSFKFYFSALTSFQYFVGKIGGMLNAANHPATSRIALGLLYVLIFSGFALVAFGVSIAHWITAIIGLKSMLGCLMAYIGVMCGLVWAINKINAALPTLDIPPASNLLGQAWGIEETVTHDVASLTSVEKSQLSQDFHQDKAQPK
ncbi:hypothetical protein [Mesorhizobium sp. BH1-1-4]|uniref:hypothetical protein n=1 Tax=Mesorhizobium sp. BH1-1-4 TaxID=2876662 RepID=UPI001CD0872C|nr:hypothetical protein [Mesorhizobium sp. BH1-1-4]MBZ9997443.1 hypothetical protein [Mesorhizobium sp. BH1-1-4]